MDVLLSRRHDSRVGSRNNTLLEISAENMKHTQHLILLNGFWRIMYKRKNPNYKGNE